MHFFPADLLISCTIPKFVHEFVHNHANCLLIVGICQLNRGAAPIVKANSY